MATRIPVKMQHPDNEPVELKVEDFDREVSEEEVNEVFDNTYKDSSVKVPLYKKWWFWILLLALIVGVILGLRASGVLSAIENDDETGTTVTVTEQSVTEPQYIGQTAEANDVVVPAGASVIKGSEGWGLYDANRRLVSSYNGIASNNNGTWYIKDGKVNFGFDGELTVNGSTYPVKGGKVDITAPKADPTQGTETQQKALEKAKEHIREMPLSYSSLQSLLISDNFTREDAAWACDHCGADWNEMARQKALENLNLTTFSHEDLVDQLIYEGFTREQAEYGATKAGV